jgi:hypothetical protein
MKQFIRKDLLDLIVFLQNFQEITKTVQRSQRNNDNIQMDKYFISVGVNLSVDFESNF